ncbi:DUF5984 family protein [Paenibacillus polymyxa]|uniref:DUF5984 family protein n=1 Tax=Paenibacillus TaxID=44249 RepID=UPI00042EB1F9|nr:MULTISPECIES: DUF5984 family protein [Paenibacillus]MEB4783059.1 DUF5984 family protein [Paenibacillus jamilae]AHM67457.1 hypothetical protein PPSQR21_038190 [Paenibacillus polymyxa SQR-21]KAF6659594.1 hypothetical protein HFD99_05195 [Paenibacillus sp. EKM301P]MBE3646963.1 hypothetical protein [Paenibacillus polymyxa]MDN4084220.1 DUF5984 family protein [Paenibacillus polymyxa]
MRCVILRTFGDKSTFAIQYELVNNPFNEKSLAGESWGEIEIFVRGRNIFEYKKENVVTPFQWNLIYIVEWFSENHMHILSDEAFPLPVEGQNSLELIDNCLLFDSDNDAEFDQWFDTKQEWEFKHSWFSNRAGSFLPDVFFRRVNDKIEIAWDNESTYSSEGITFMNPIGVEYIPIGIFDSTVRNFVEDFLDNLLLNSKNKSDAEKICEKIKGLIVQE